MSTTVSYRGYDGSIIHDPEESIYHGKILGIRDFVIYHGDTPEQAEQVFHQAVDEFLQDCEQSDRQPPKPFKTRQNRPSFSPSTSLYIGWVKTLPRRT